MSLIGRTSSSPETFKKVSSEMRALKSVDFDSENLIN